MNNFFFLLRSLTQLAWICAQQRQNLNSLILSRPDTGPSVCCQKANLLENTKFVDAHKAKGIKYQVNNEFQNWGGVIVIHVNSSCISFVLGVYEFYLFYLKV